MTHLPCSKLTFPTRLGVILLVMVGTMTFYWHRMNMSVAMVAMVDRPQPNGSEIIAPTYKWLPSTQGHILGAYFYGYTIFQPFGAAIAKRFDAVRVITIAMFVSSILTILTPLVASWHVGVLIATRVLVGLSHSTFFTCQIVIDTQWSPKSERATAVSTIGIGAHIGAAVGMPLTAWMCEAFGYPVSFYVPGAFTILWSIACYYYATTTPHENKFISEKELDYIKSDNDCTASIKDCPTPWCAIITDKSVWAIIVSKGLYSFGYLVISTKGPAYLEEVVGVPMHRNGFINSLAFLATAFTNTLCGPLSDYIIYKKIFSRTTTRKLFQTLGVTTAGIALIAIPLVGTDETAVSCLLFLSMFGNGMNSGGETAMIGNYHRSNKIDNCFETTGEMAPDFGSYIYAFANTCGSCMGILAPLLVGLMLELYSGKLAWDIVFFLSGGMYILSGVLFDLFTTSECKPWGIASVGKKTLPA